MALPRRYYVANYKKGWSGDSVRHSLAARGIASGRKARSSSYAAMPVGEAIERLQMERGDMRASPAYEDVGQTEEVTRSVQPLQATAELPSSRGEEVVAVDEPDVEISERVDVSEPDPLMTMPGSRQGARVMTPGVPPAPSGVGEESARIIL